MIISLSIHPIALNFMHYTLLIMCIVLYPTFYGGPGTEETTWI